MTNLIINRVNYILSERQPNLYLSKVDNLVFKMQFIHFKKRLTNHFKDDNLLDWLKDFNDEDYIYYSFTLPTFNDFITITDENYPFNYFKAKFIREQLINFFNLRNFLVEPFPKGNDLVLRSLPRSAKSPDLVVAFNPDSYRNLIYTSN